ncbi:hypothetical protein quinque_000210, partial [Culex quinquefasciatus]
MLRLLKRATITLSNEPDPFEPLECVNYSLESMSIYAEHRRATNLSQYYCPNLRELTLCGMDMAIGKLAPLLTNSHRIDTLTLQRCRIRENYGVYCILRYLPSLRKLTLDSAHLTSWNHTDKTFAHSLQTLNLNHLTTNRDQLLTIAEVFPHLKQLHLQNLPADDAVIRYLCQKLPHLQTLAITNCPISDASTNFIGQHGRALNHLELIDNSKLSKGAVNRLKRRGVCPEVVFKPPLTPAVLVKSLLAVVAHRVACSPLTVVNCLLPKVGVKPWRPDFLRVELGEEFAFKNL